MYNITAIAYDKRGRVLAVGKNSYVKTHPLQAKFAEKAGRPGSIYLHAEISCLVKVKNPDKIHVLAVFRYDKHGQPKNARPCKICREAIKQFGVKNVRYTVG